MKNHSTWFRNAHIRMRIYDQNKQVKLLLFSELAKHRKFAGDALPERRRKVDQAGRERTDGHPPGGLGAPQSEQSTDCGAWGIASAFLDETWQEYVT